jgi:hypothetical protein
MLVLLPFSILEKIPDGVEYKVNPPETHIVQRLTSPAEAWGEDMVLTSHMGVAYASGLSKNSSWSEPDAVVPVMKV